MTTEEIKKEARDNGVREELMTHFINCVYMRLGYLDERQALDACLKRFVDPEFDSVPSP
ncbi:hypothetical protein GF324_06515 [bacterium]|nr:hypothetical protein [bacterium]